MLKYLMLLLLTTILFAQNPFPYAALGDLIYDNVNKIKNLENINVLKKYSIEINKYTSDVALAKKEGFKLDHNSSQAQRKHYLNHLRELAQQNDFFKRLVDVAYKNAIKKEDTQTFSALINSGLLDTEKYKKEIIDYYFEHQQELPATGLIQSYLDEDAKLRAKKEAQQKRYKSKKEREAERIRWIREEDKRQKEYLEKKLQKELEEKKQEIREYQKTELSKTI